MRTWSSGTASVSARTVVAKKARVSVDPAGATAAQLSRLLSVRTGRTRAVGRVGLGEWTRRRMKELAEAAEKKPAREAP